MTLNKLLPALATIAGGALGFALYSWLHQTLPSPLTDANSGVFTPAQLLRRLFVALCLLSALGGAATAWLGWRLSDWEGSSPALAGFLFGVATSAAAGILGFTYMPDASRQILWTLPATGSMAWVGASLSWWIANGSPPQ